MILEVVLNFLEVIDKEKRKVTKRISSIAHKSAFTVYARIVACKEKNKERTLREELPISSHQIISNV